MARSVKQTRPPFVASRHPRNLKSIFLIIAALGLAAPTLHILDPLQSIHASQALKTIVDLQTHRQTSKIQIEGANGKRGEAVLINLNPAVNQWYLLQLLWRDGAPKETYHLENPYPQLQRLVVEQSHPGGLVIVEKSARYPFTLWSAGSTDALAEARASKRTFAPLCDGRVYLRNAAKGHRTKIEQAAEFLREDVPGGEKIVTYVRRVFFRDAYKESAKVIAGNKVDYEEALMKKMSEAPRTASLNSVYAGQVISTGTLGIDIEIPAAKGLVMGKWYPVVDNPGIFVSLIIPNAISRETLQSHRQSVSDMDSVEAGALVYLLAFDLQYFDLGFALGTEHPQLGWSLNMLDRMKDNSLPGPDGIGSAAPLINTGLLSPEKSLRTAAIFTGGFKRTHGAFKYGDLALKNRGTHYGFIESGVVFSRLQPGLSTLFALHDGTVEMKTWSESDNVNLPKIKHARQNGVPIIDFNEVSRISSPGALVGRWGAGNWAGSENGKLRTLRAGVALQEFQGRRSLIYAVFSTATPSAMVRVFQAYECRYAMLLDMNALEHTYSAVYRKVGANLFTQHLLQGMRVLDKVAGGEYVPRFLGYADNRDFFYLMKKHPEKNKP